MPSTSTRSPRRQGRPTLDEAARLDHDVREHALRLFLEQGYEGTSMEAIAEAAGSTKASLYARFPGKESLFQSVLIWAVGRTDWPAPEPPPPASVSRDHSTQARRFTRVRRRPFPQGGGGA